MRPPVEARPVQDFRGGPGDARKVLISAPGKGADLTVVVGVNDASYDPQRHDIVSAASCTTNRVVPMAKMLHDSCGGGRRCAARAVRRGAEALGRVAGGAPGSLVGMVMTAERTG